MKIKIPELESKILHFTVTPTLPEGGKAGDWKFVCPAVSGDTHITSLDISFKKSTPADQRRNEQAILVISIDETAQSSSDTWRFYGPGVLFAPGYGDVKDCFDFTLASDQTTLVIAITCLDDAGEDFKFSFSAMHTNVESGECRVLASADPVGAIGRPD